MRTSSRFAIAIHLLVLAKDARDVAVTSERMAERLDANPVVLRRILGALRDAGLVASQPGPGGGWRLTRPVEAITLRDVYRAVEQRPIFSLPLREPSVEFAGGSRLLSVLETCCREAEDAMAERLSHVTIADVISSVLSDAWRTSSALRSWNDKEVRMQTVL